jgi:hypothetical protein
MGFFDKKEDVMEIELTPHGRYLLSQGKLMPAFYAFLDDDILYDVSAAGTSESNYQVKDRILENTPSMKPQTGFTDLEIKITDLTPDLTSDTIKYNLYTIGTSNNLENYAPSWNLTMIQNEISSSSRLWSLNSQELAVPQINVDIEYTLSVGNINNDSSPRGLAPSPDLQVGKVFQDGSYVKVQPEQALFHILEKNGFLHGESLEIEVFKYDTDSDTTEKLIPLHFAKRQELIKSDILMDDLGLPKPVDLDPSLVEYFFDIRVDKEVPLNDICSGISKLKSNGIFGDFEIECPDTKQKVDVDIYSSPISSDDIEDCD